MKCAVKLPWDDDATFKKLMEDSWVRFSVEGYNTSLPADDIKKALSSHFSSCGEIWSVVVPRDPVTDAVERCSYIVIRGDGSSVQDKALKLDGSDLGGCNLTVKVAPKKYNEATPQQLDAMRKLRFDKKYMFGISVRGYDTSLPDDDVKSALRAHFASSGDITHVSVNTLDRRAFVYFSGKEALDKALKPGASDVRGWKLVVRALPGIRPGSGIGYTIQPHCIEMTNEIWAMKATTTTE